MDPEQGIDRVADVHLADGMTTSNISPLEAAGSANHRMER
jgi:hypothetical protein